MIGLALGNAASFVVPARRLLRLGVASPLPELLYTFVGACLAALALGAGRFSAGVVPIADPALRTLLVGGAVIAPFALWATRRILRELRTS